MTSEVVADSFDGKKAVVVINARSRRGKFFFKRCLDLLGNHGIEIVSSKLTNSPKKLQKIVKRLIDDGHRFIIVGGGDGSLSSIVDLFAFRDIVLGILPLGTGNSFARSLGIPIDIEGAIKVIASGKVAEVDLGKANDDYFSNSATIGFTADIARYTPYWAKQIFGVFAYVLTGIVIFSNHHSFKCKIIMDDETLTVKTHQIIVANGEFYGITPLGDKVKLDNKELLVFTMEAMNRWQTIKLWLDFFLKKDKTIDRICYYKTKKVEIITEIPKFIDIDGEPLMKTPVTFSLVSNALKVMVPESFVDV
jgi:YegS/Rv2252/BmrU family lipid kinase